MVVKGSKKRPYQDYRWNRFKNFDPRDMYTIVSEHVFPWLRTLGGNGTTYSKHMEGARFTIPTPALLAKVVDTQSRSSHLRLKAVLKRLSPPGTTHSSLWNSNGRGQDTIKGTIP